MRVHNIIQTGFGHHYDVQEMGYGPVIIDTEYRDWQPLHLQDIAHTLYMLHVYMYSVHDVCSHTLEETIPCLITMKWHFSCV